MNITEEKINELRRNAHLCALEWVRQSTPDYLDERGVEHFEPASGDWDGSLDEVGIHNVDSLTDEKQDILIDAFNESFSGALSIVQSHLDEFDSPQRTLDILNSEVDISEFEDHDMNSYLAALENDEIK